MNIRCPHCQTLYKAEKSEMYRYTKCAVCGKGFVIGAESIISPKNTHSGSVQDSSREESLLRHKRARQPDTGSIKLPDDRAAHLPKNDVNAKFRPKSKKKTLRFVLWSMTLLIVSGTMTFFGYMYFGDAPRLERGVAYYEKGSFDKAYKILHPLACKGYAKAQLIVGDCLANGQGVCKDIEEAVQWYRSAADQDLPEAQYRMYLCYSEGSGVDCNSHNAAKWCRKAAEAGFKDAMSEMGRLYATGTGVEMNPKNAFKWFRKGAERGHPMSLYKFGQCYKFGFGTAKDEDEASKWQNKAVDAWREMANNGNTEAIHRLAYMYEHGDVVDLNMGRENIFLYWPR